MRIVITNDQSNIAILEDFSGLEEPGLIGQVIAELEVLKNKLIRMYTGNRLND